MQLQEKSLKQNTLKDLIHPIISIDEYTPKIDSSNIVVNFKVLDNFDAAYDLSSFIEKSPEDVVDTEAAETPDVDGLYNVFVEMKRDGEFPESLVQLIKDIENLSGTVQWKLQLYKVNDPIDLNLKKLRKNVQLSTELELKEFFNAAPVNVQLTEEYINITSAFGHSMYFEKGSSAITESTVQFKLKQDFKLDDTGLSSVLGENYTVLKCSGEYIIECSTNGKFMLLR